MGTAIAILVIISLILIIGSIANANAKPKRVRNPARPPVSPRPPAPPPGPPGMSFRIERRTQLYSPSRPGPTRPGQTPQRPGPVNGGGFIPGPRTVNTSAYCQFTGRQVADCTCKRCLNVKSNAGNGGGR